MGGFYALGIAISLFFQGLGAWLKVPMTLFTSMGEETFFLAVIPVIYWVIDPVIGLRMGLVLMGSDCFNGFFKILFHQPRPFWIDTRVQAMRMETTFGLPSGHAQLAASIWGALAASLKKGWIWVVVVFVVLMIGSSRIYLGVHFWTDVLGGWLIGAVLVWLTFRLEKPLLSWFSQHKLATNLLVVLGVSVGFILLDGLAYIFLGAWQIPVEWVANASLAYPGLPAGVKALDPLAISGVFTGAGAFLGLAAGGLVLPNMGGFRVTGPWWKRVLRILVGGVGVLALYLGLKLIFPDGESVLPLLLRFIRYALMCFWAIAGAPWLFTQIGLAKKA